MTSATFIKDIIDIYNCPDFNTFLWNSWCHSDVGTGYWARHIDDLIWSGNSPVPAVSFWYKLNCKNFTIFGLQGKSYLQQRKQLPLPLVPFPFITHWKRAACPEREVLDLIDKPAGTVHFLWNSEVFSKSFWYILNPSQYASVSNLSSFLPSMFC